MPISITHDGVLDIATGRSRKETNWKNTEYKWSDFVKRLSKTHYTIETFKEYLASKKPRQDEIKDVGGFVGGYLTSGRRKPENVVHRQLITLDIDFAHANIWDDFNMLYGNAAILYSTHKHCPDSPRYRLILPLDRPVFTDEYVAISRRIAGVLGIDYFDDTTYQPERLMYWPSTASDAEYVFQYQDGPWIKADEILSTYRDWRDSSEWATSSRVDKIMQREALKQGDPLEKPGLVGAFCRTYSIEEAINSFLSEVYDTCDIENRFTYKHGSTAAGLVVYDDKFAYSHHGTDPISGKLCNAFDLVRIHKFGLKDSGAANQAASTAAMWEFVTKDEHVKKQLGIERLANAKYDFTEAPEEVEAEPYNDDWMKDLSVEKKSGAYLSTIDNIYLILKNDLHIRNILYYDEFECRLIAKRNLPWRQVTKHTRDFTDDDCDCLAHYLECYKMPFTYIQKALAKIRTDYKTHPVKDYLNGLVWDGIDRLSTLFIEYLGAEDTPYTRSVTKKTLVAAVARVMEPGIKFDTVLTLVGKEGIGKSTILTKLARDWFSDCLGDIHTKEGMESLRGVWIMEIAELASFRKADQTAIKGFVTRCEDLYRPAYGRQQMKYPRQCIFFATTNLPDFLTGPDEHRRFLPVDTHVQPPTKSVFTQLTDAEINQIWAEAVLYYRQGESLDLEQEVKLYAAKIREAHTEVDERAGLIEQYLNTLLPDNWDSLNIYERRAFLAGGDLDPIGTVARKFVCVAEIWCEVLGGTTKDMTSANTKYIHNILKKMKGWERGETSRRFSVYGTQRFYKTVNKFGNSKISVDKTLSTV